MSEIQLLEKGLSLQQNGNFDQAEILYQQVLEINPVNDNALYFIGMIAYQRNQIDKAKDLLIKAAELNPNVDYYLTLGDLFSEIEQIEESAKYYKQALDLKPQNFELLFINANCFFNCQKYDEALELYNALLLIEPDNLEVNFNAAIAYKNKNDYNSSVKYLNKCLELNPEYIEAFEQLGEIFTKVQNYPIAYDYYDAALRIKLDRTVETETCRVCGSQSKHIHNGQILGKHNIKYFYCINCGFLQSEQPYWLEEAYEDAINIYDTGIMARNLDMSVRATVILYFLFNRKAKFLDYAGGYGIFTRLMRDTGFDFYWNDLYSKNLVARGFEFHENTGKMELITSFECLEHLPNPIETIEQMLSISDNLLLSTTLLPFPIPKVNEWSYYATVHGQHISFYSIKTLEYIAEKYNLYIYSIDDLHLLTKKKISSKYIEKFKSKQVQSYFYNRIRQKMTSRICSDTTIVSR